jgi:hypothetical protein
MILISHRGNLEGPNPERENNPEYIDEALRAGYHCEIDVWIKDDKLFLGHDEPQYHVDGAWLNERFHMLWIHCKDMESLSKFNELDMIGSKLNYFSHENDLGVLTSKGYIWSTNLYDRGILVMPEVYGKEPKETTLGVCSDYITNYQNIR